ncbi:MAG: chromosome segregation protein SMC [Candidatus Bathyarchaeia archaeon]
MPYIKRIEIDGFKTFGLKTTLTFEKGFTVITGPNGSGKTNIIDAVLFCFGELSAKRLRVENFSNLIFNGGEKSNIRKNVAKVTIQIDNSDGRIPVDTTTVTITREIDRNGESIYRINGRKVPRAHLLEVLSVAGITPYGHNIVLQGTLTRMAEISTIERRKIIEDMLGIAQYDAEKAEAEQKLKEADIAIKTALGQISEVQRRVEDLERERNNLLRHNLLRREIARLESIKISRNIRELETEAKSLLEELSRAEEKNKLVSEQRESLKIKRRDLENELRNLGFYEIQEKSSRMIEIEVNIRSLKSKLSEILSKINNDQANLSRLKSLREKLKQQIESLRGEIESSEDRAKQLTVLLEQISKEIEEKQSLYDSISRDLSDVRSVFEEKVKQIDEIERQISRTREERVKLEGERARLQSEINVYLQRLEGLKTKREELLSAGEKLREFLIKLEEVAGSQRKRVNDLKSSLERYVKKRSSIEKEIKEAEKIAEVAGEALVKFETQKNLIKKIKPEEVALKHLEELGAAGAISGIHGRLRNLIKIDDDYAKAIEAAASGWLDALVVDDLNVAFACIEALKHMRLGRIKIIPLKNLMPNTHINKTVNIAGLMGWASSFIHCDEYYKPAVEFVFGDTLLALSGDAALRASKEGFRAATLDGDLYEAWGGVESGFYRRSLDLSSFIPSEEALKSLDKAVAALRKYLDNRKGIIAELEDEISKTQNDLISLSELLVKIEGEIDRVKRTLSQTESQIRSIETAMKGLADHVEHERGRLATLEAGIIELSNMENTLKSEYERLKGDVDMLRFHDAEKRRSDIAQEIMRLKQRYNDVKLELSTIRMRIEKVLNKNIENLVAQLNEVTTQIAGLENDLREASREEEEIRRKIEDLERLKEDFSREISASKEKISVYTSQIDALDVELSRLDREYDEGIRTINDLKIKLQNINLHASRLKERLRELGYEEPPEDLEDLSTEEIELSLKVIGEELKRIGAVNQLAESQYLEVISRYKELSTRLNELEKERSAIIKFIDEIEQKKTRVFMDAFNKINEGIKSYFSKLTGGGSAFLKLESQDNPFAGGVDMIVQFPGKSPIPVSGASSGERSVSAVAFLLALQEFSPASFYLFDEIDAHLDAFHVERLGELLSEEASGKQLQFIVITLKPEMISKADKVYGIYGQNGVSHVVSMTLKGVA